MEPKAGLIFFFSALFRKGNNAITFWPTLIGKDNEMRENLFVF